MRSSIAARACLFGFRLEIFATARYFLYSVPASLVRPTFQKQSAKFKRATARLGSNLMTSCNLGIAVAAIARFGDEECLVIQRLNNDRKRLETRSGFMWFAGDDSLGNACLLQFRAKATGRFLRMA